MYKSNLGTVEGCIQTNLTLDSTVEHCILQSPLSLSESRKSIYKNPSWEGYNYIHFTTAFSDTSITTEAFLHM
jgi:hypothetical protein